jgi:hypothetical protein
LFSRQEREKFEREEKVRIARGGTEFYAPERRIEEYFAEGVRDWVIREDDDTIFVI